MSSEQKITKQTFIDGDFSMDINVSEEERTIYMSQKEIAELLGISRVTVTKNITIIAENQMGQCSKNEQNRNIMFQNRTSYYSLEIIKEIGQKYNPERLEKLENWLTNLFSYNLPVALEESFKILRYNHNNLNLKVKVDFINHTAWLTQEEIALVLGVSVSNISEHISHIYDDEELEVEATLRNFRIVRFEGNLIVGV